MSFLRPKKIRTDSGLQGDESKYCKSYKLSIIDVTSFKKGISVKKIELIGILPPLETSRFLTIENPYKTQTLS